MRSPLGNIRSRPGIFTLFSFIFLAKRPCPGEDAIYATDQRLLMDRDPVPQRCRRHPARMSSNINVHICFRFLSSPEQYHVSFSPLPIICFRTIFEDNQADLERATERLSEYLERDLEIEETENLPDLKRKVQDLYRYVDQRRKVLLKHCAEGTERNEWKFNAHL